MQLDVNVGKGDRDYPGYRKLTAADVVDVAMCARLLAAHQVDGGWALLEEPLICNSRLCIAEGFLVVNGWLVIEDGYSYDPPQKLRSRSPALAEITKTALMGTPPPLDCHFTFLPKNIRDFPCLFVRQ